MLFILLWDCNHHLIICHFFVNNLVTMYACSFSVQSLVSVFFTFVHTSFFSPGQYLHKLLFVFRSIT